MIRITRLSQGLNQCIFHISPVVHICSVQGLQWLWPEVYLPVGQTATQVFMLHISVLDHHCRCVREVTKAIFFLYIEPRICPLQDVLPSFIQL